MPKDDINKVNLKDEINRIKDSEPKKKPILKKERVFDEEKLCQFGTCSTEGQIYRCPDCGKNYCIRHIHTHYCEKPEDKDLFDNRPDQYLEPEDIIEPKRPFPIVPIVVILFIVIVIGLLVFWGKGMALTSPANTVPTQITTIPTTQIPVSNISINQTNTTSINILNQTPVTIIPTNPPSIFYKTYPYTVRNTSRLLSLPLDMMEYNGLKQTPDPVECYKMPWDTSPCSYSDNQNYLISYLNEPTETQYLDLVISNIQSNTPNKDDQVRLAVNFVQQMPYDDTEYINVLTKNNTRVKYPYEVLYENKGICLDKSLLLVYLLKGLGYSTAIFQFVPENHIAVGIKSPVAYSFQNSGYAFIESTLPSIITDSSGEYGDKRQKLTSKAIVFNMSDGKSMNSIGEEYSDAKSLEVLNNMSKTNNSLDESHFTQWMILVNKYGLYINNSN